MKKMTKTPLLSELYFACREKYSEYFTDVTDNEKLALIESDMENDIKDFLNQEQILNMQDKMGLIECECLYMGFIDGFKMAKKLIGELGMTDDPDFLKEILIQDSELEGREVNQEEKGEQNRTDRSDRYINVATVIKTIAYGCNNFEDRPRNTTDELIGALQTTADALITFADYTAQDHLVGNIASVIKMIAYSCMNFTDRPYTAKELRDIIIDIDESLMTLADYMLIFYKRKELS